MGFSSFSFPRHAWRSAALGVVSAAVMSLTAQAQNAASEFSQRECRLLFATSADTIGSYKGKLNPIFTTAMAELIAPPSKTDKTADVHKILLEGSFDKFAHPDPKKPEQVQFTLGILKALTCDGPESSKLIPTPDGGDEAAASISIRVKLNSGSGPFNLDTKSVRFVKPTGATKPATPR